MENSMQKTDVPPKAATQKSVRTAEQQKTFKIRQRRKRERAGKATLAKSYH
jgi:hypothetical protein